MKALDAVKKEMTSISEQKAQLREEMKEIEIDTFKDFCKKMKVKTIQQFELKIFDDKSDFLVERMNLMHRVCKLETEINFAES